MLSSLLGHCIFDEVDPDVGQVDPTDHLFTYNDEEVTDTSGTSVCGGKKTNTLCSKAKHITEMMWQRHIIHIYFQDLMMGCSIRSQNP